MLIRWTDRERLAVATKYAELITKCSPEGISTFNCAQSNAVVDGKLDSCRVRKVSTIQAIGTWFKPLVRMVIQDMQQAASIQKAESVKVAADTSIETVSTDRLLSELIRRGLVSALEDEGLLSRIIAPITAKLEVSITDALSAKILSALPSVISASADSIHISADSTDQHNITEHVAQCKSIKKQKLVVIGLKGGQPQSVKDKIDSDDIKITFYESRVTASQLKATLKHTDYVFFMSDWNNHSTQAVVKNSNVPFEFVTGTVTNLVRRIREVSGVQ